MATLGAALGFSATAAAADHASKYTVTADGAENVAAGFSIGAGVWLLLSAAIVGGVGGCVLAKMSHVERAYSPRVLGVVTWACGLTIAALLAASGASGLATGLGVGATGVAAHAPNSIRSLEVGSSIPLDRGVDARGNAARATEASLGRNAPTWTPAEREAAIIAAETAATAVATAAWFALVAQLIGLGATLWAAGRRKFQPDVEQVALQRA